MADKRRERPSTDEISQELRARERRRRMHRVIAGSVGVLLTSAALIVLLATYLFPTLRIYGSSMDPTLREGDVVVCVRGTDYGTGDIVAFYHNNKVLVKRVICGPGEWFNMQDDGSVFVNGELLDEPYVKEPGFGSCDVRLPYQVPDDEYFVMGDLRQSSIDSRLAQVGCVPSDRMVGKIVLRVWPMQDFGIVG